MIDIKFIRENPKLVAEGAKQKGYVPNIEKLLDVDEKRRKLIEEVEKLNEEYYQLIREVPNLPKDDVPVGRDENDNKILREIGEKPKFDFDPKDHLELGLGLDLIDTERAA